VSPSPPEPLAAPVRRAPGSGLLDDERARTHGRMSRWFAVGVAAPPALDVLEQHALLEVVRDALTMGTWAEVKLSPWLLLAWFVAVGWGARAAMAMQSTHAARLGLFAGGSALIALYVVTTGLRLSGLLALVALPYTLVQLQLLPPLEARAARG